MISLQKWDYVIAESLKSKMTVLLIILRGSSTKCFNKTELALPAMLRIGTNNGVRSLVDDGELNADTVGGLGLKWDWK